MTPKVALLLPPLKEPLLVVHVLRVVLLQLLLVACSVCWRRLLQHHHGAAMLREVPGAHFELAECEETALMGLTL